VQPIRRRITEILKEHGSATVAELAGELGMAQVSVRHHLDILIGEDFVEAAGVRRRDGAGRPSQVYGLTPQAVKLFPQRHDVIADGMLAEVKKMLSADEVLGVFSRLAEKTAHEAPPGSPDQHLEDRLDEVAHFLTEKGYDARWELRDGSYEVHACNCPYVGVSDRHPELCGMDQSLMQHLLPGLVRLESRALDGALQCTYLLTLEPLVDKA